MAKRVKNYTRQKRDSNKTRSAKNKRHIQILTGTLDCRGSRFGFLIPDDGSEDIFIAGRNLALAHNGDYVSVEIVEGSSHQSNSREGVVREIIQKNNGAIVGTVINENGQYYFVPDDKRYGEKLNVAYLNGCSSGDKAVVEFSNGDNVNITKRLGRKDALGVDVLSVLFANNIKTEFDKAVLEQSQKINEKIPKEEFFKRRDLRGQLIFTIDGEDSKDFDDAVSLTFEQGMYKLGVYIADVTHYVSYKSPLDNEALLRGTSIYLADRVVPMLPEKLSNDLCSLNENADRLALGVEILLNDKGDYVSHEIFECVINSKARLTYKAVAAMLANDKTLLSRYDFLKDMLFLMQDLAQVLISKRKIRGSIDFEISESEMTFDKDGKPIDLKKRDRLISHRIIEEFMVLTNEVVARFALGKKLPFIFRVHERPSVEKMEALNEFLKAVNLNYQCPQNPSSKDISELLKNVPAEILSAVSRVTLTSMTKASYESENFGHFGLALNDYCHFTSPIRRYPDLMIHRIIKTFLNGGKRAVGAFYDVVGEISKRNSVSERLAQTCERKVDDIKKAQYMSAFIGETFNGMISSVTEFGFFVELDNIAEGLVHISSFKTPLTFNPRNLSLSGGGKVFKIGDRVDIMVKEIIGDKISFDMIELPLN